MKKYLLLLICATALFSSCKKETFVQDTPNRTILVDLKPADWKLSSDNHSYYQNISLPENDQYLNQSGQVIVAMAFEDENQYEALPMVYEGFAYGFYYKPGVLTVTVDDVYGTDKITPPNAIVTAKITLLDGQIIN